MAAALGAIVLSLNACAAADTPSPSVSMGPSQSPSPGTAPDGSPLPPASPEPQPSRAPYQPLPSEIGQVIATEPLIIRSQPGTGAGADPLGARLYPGMRFRFLEGPVSESGYNWYLVRVGELEGWVADGLRSGGAFEPWLARVGNGRVALSATDFGTAIPQVNLFEPSGEPVVQLTNLTDDALAGGPTARGHGNVLALSCGSEVDWLTWSADGLTLAFAFGSCDRAIYTVASVAGGQRRIADGRTLALSPDGRQLVVSENYPYIGCTDPGCDSGPWDLHRIDLATGDETLLTHSDPFVTAAWPDWSPDGHTVAFMADTVGSPRASVLAVWVVDIATGVEHYVASGERPRWSPDGTRMAILRQSSYQEPPVIWIIGANGSDIGKVGVGYPPAWSPAGELIGYWRQTENLVPEAVVSAPDGTGQVVAPVSGRFLGWSPDGREVLIAGEETLWRWTPGEADVSVILDGSYVSSAAWQPQLVPIGIDGW
jgi:hypothetical protein